MGSVPSQGRFLMSRGNEACAPQLLRPGSTAGAPQQEKPPKWEPAQHNQRKPQWRPSATENNLLKLSSLKTIALARQTFVSKIMPLLFNMLSKWVIAFLPRSKHLLISWLQSPSAVICMDVRVELHRKLSTEELMLLNCGVGEDSWESLGLQGDPTSPS